MTILTQGETAIKYSHECGYYALLDGRILDDGTGISGTWEQAWERLLFTLEDNRTPQQAAGDYYQEMLSVPGWAESLPF